MTTTQRQRPPRQAPPAPDPASRGLILVAVAVVLGVILLIKGGGVGFDRDDSQLEIGSEDPSGAPADPEGTTTTEAPPQTSVPPAELPIAALNAAGVDGYAGQAQQFLSVAGYNSVTPLTAAAPSEQTIIYFVEGYQVDAFMVAQLFQVEASQVQRLPDDPASLSSAPGDFPTNAGVVVLLASDVAATVQGGAGTAPADDAGAADAGT